ncbi:MAG: enoyl-CoA hydratase/isomerase family protein [Pseudomonadota bacterium]|nr:enoyl-CoA hydratase/isomerase family protein [Pseudomonadota bacterium]
MTLRLETDGAVARLLIDRSQKRNSMSLAMWEALPELLTDACENPEIGVIELTAADRNSAFCAGADIGEMLAHRDDPQWLSRKQSAINRAQYELARCPLPTVAFVNGDCIGGGCGLAMACDMRIAVPTARFGITPAKLGLVYPLHDVKLLIDLVGPGQARRLLYTGALIDATEARRIGLAEMIADNSDSLIAGIVAGSPYSQSQAKRFVQLALDGQSVDDEATLDAFAKAFAAADFTEGANAFIDKRKPRFGRAASQTGKTE